MGTATFAITPMEDALEEGNENIVVSGTATGGFSGTVNSATVTLTDNDRDVEPPEFRWRGGQWGHAGADV